jgi:hypothetical protein
MQESVPTPNNQEEVEDTSYVDMAEGKSPMEAVREAQVSGDPVAVEQAQAAADEKYMVTPEHKEDQVAIMRTQTQKAIDDLLAYISNPKNPIDANAVESLVANVANDMDSLRTLQVKSGQENAAVADQVEAFPSLNDPALVPLKEALLSYKQTDYGAPLQAAQALAEEHRKLVKRTQAESMGI